MSTRDTGRADYQRTQARLLAERNEKPAERPEDSILAPIGPEVATDSTESDGGCL